MGLFLKYNFRKMGTHLVQIVSVILLIFLSSLIINVLISSQQSTSKIMNIYRNSDEGGPGFTGFVNATSWWNKYYQNNKISLTDTGLSKLLEYLSKWNNSSSCHSNCIDVEYKPNNTTVSFKKTNLNYFLKNSSKEQLQSYLQHRFTSNINNSLDIWSNKNMLKNKFKQNNKMIFKIITNNQDFNKFNHSDIDFLFDSLLNKIISEKHLNIKWSIRLKYQILNEDVNKPPFGYILPIAQSNTIKSTAMSQNTDKLVITQGRTPTQSNEIALTWKYLKEKGYSLNQYISLGPIRNIKQTKSDNNVPKNIKLKIVGIGNTDVDLTSLETTPFIMYVNTNKFYSSSSSSIWNDPYLSFCKNSLNNVNIYFHGSKKDIDSLLAQMNSEMKTYFGLNLAAFSDAYLSYDQSVENYFDNIRSILAMLVIWLTVLVAIIDGFVIIALLKSIFRLWKYDLGILKASGYSKIELVLLLSILPAVFSFVAFNLGFWAGLLIDHLVFTNVWKQVVTANISTEYFSWIALLIIALVLPFIMVIFSASYSMIKLKIPVLFLFSQNPIYSKNNFKNIVAQKGRSIIKIVGFYEYRSTSSKLKLSFYLSQIFRNLTSMVIIGVSAILFSFPLLFRSTEINTNRYVKSLIKESLTKTNVAIPDSDYLNNVMTKTPFSQHVWSDITNKQFFKNFKSIKLSTFSNIIQSVYNSRISQSAADLKIYNLLSKQNYYLSAVTIEKLFNNVTNNDKRIIKNYLKHSNCINFIKNNSEQYRNIVFGSQPFFENAVSPTYVSTQNIVNMSSNLNKFVSQIYQVSNNFSNFFNLDQTASETKTILGNIWSNASKNQYGIYAAISPQLVKKQKIKLNPLIPRFRIKFTQTIANHQFSYYIPIIPVATVPRALNINAMFISSDQVSEYIRDVYKVNLDPNNIAGGLTYSPLSKIKNDYVGTFYDIKNNSYEPTISNIKNVEGFFGIGILTDTNIIVTTSTVVTSVVILITAVIILAFSSSILSDNQRIITILKITGYKVREIVEIVLAYYAVTTLAGLGIGIGLSYLMVSIYIKLLYKISKFQLYNGFIPETLIVIIFVLIGLVLLIFTVGFILSHRVNLNIPYSE